MRTSDIHRLADEELMVLLRDGNPDAFEAVYDRHGKPAYSLAYRIVGDRSAAEDVAQEAFMSIWRSRVRYDPQRGSVRTWVLGIVHHRAIDALRRNAGHVKNQTSDEGIEERHEAPDRTDAEVARRDEARVVREALSELPDNQFEVVRLAYFGGFSHTEIADMLGEPIGTVKGRMRLGLEKMRRALGGQFAT
jgi:RNA polymerase sigma-70 factor (ECF subfamily)